MELHEDAVRLVLGKKYGDYGVKPFGVPEWVGCVSRSGGSLCGGLCGLDGMSQKFEGKKLFLVHCAWEHCPEKTQGQQEGNMTINELIEQAHATAEEKGWHERKRTFGELIALCHSELSEALEEYRKGCLPDQRGYEAGSSKPIGVPIELADVLIRIFDLCGAYGIDLEEALEIKMEYNKTRTYRHGNKVI